MEFSRKLPLLRASRGMTQTRLAEALGVTRQSVYKWESGQSYPEAMTLLALRALFGVSVDTLLDPEAELPPALVATPADAGGVVSAEPQKTATPAPIPQPQAIKEVPPKTATPDVQPASPTPAGTAETDAEAPSPTAATTKRKGLLARLFRA
jgi:transcriptional regulator with XRE-family HTH domain